MAEPLALPVAEPVAVPAAEPGAAFGAAPAVLMQRGILHDFERRGRVVASVYLRCGALRLRGAAICAVLVWRANPRRSQ